MKCEFHRKEAEHCESHIIPKFAYKWMKKTGSGRFRQLGKFNSPIQDGIKKYMLCKDCEGKFSKYEKWFNEKVFKPYINDCNFVVKNERELKYFIVSVLWKVLKLFKDDGNNYNFKTDLNNAEIEWGNYLLNDEPITKYKNLHLVLVDSNYWIEQKSDLYFSRSIDIEIAESDKLCFIYAKFSRFILIGEIIGFSENSFQNTNITIENEFRSTNQIINESGIIQFFMDRVNNTKEYDDLSVKQKENNAKYYKNKLESLRETDYMKLQNKYK